MDKVNENKVSLDQQLEAQLNPDVETEQYDHAESSIDNGNKQKHAPETEPGLRVLSVGEWMLTILFYIIPVVNIIMMAVWAFSSKGNIHRRNLSRALLLWVIIILIAYIVAMAVAGFTIFDIGR
jgi:NADH:ubiquinone oxidoreductase subunit 3 (subunit A)